PDRNAVRPVNKTAQPESCDPHGCADDGAYRDGEGEFEDILGVIESASATSKCIHQPGTAHGFEGVASSDAEGGSEIAGGSQINEKRADKNGWPESEAEQK